MRVILICVNLLVLCFALQAQSQSYIKGRVVQDKTGEPIGGASIFISNSTRGTVSKPDGSFELSDIPPGNHELVVSFVGYGTWAISYSASQLPFQVEVRLKPKVSELATVVVEPDEADGLRRWGKFFMESFLGTNEDALQCKLKNPEVLRFRFSKKKNVLTVVADEPLIIENRALGYNVQYQLEEFRFDFKGRYLFFLGYTLFEDMPTEKLRMKRRWEENRKKAYAGSIAHFMKSLYDNTLEQQGFVVRRLIKTPNLEKERVRTIYSSRLRAQREKGQALAVNRGDSADYYSNVLSQPDEFESILPGILSADSLLKTDTGTNKILFFNNYLHITYKNEPEEEGYVRAYNEIRGSYHQRSVVFLPNLTPIVIEKSGNYAPVREFMSYGYWSWTEKVGSMLPLDYNTRQ